MAVLKIELTEDMLKLISNIRFQEVPAPLVNDWEYEKRERIDYAIDCNSLYGGTYVFEDIAYILGRYDEHIPGTEEDPLGVQFPEDFENYMWGLHTYVTENLDAVEELVHQFCNKGGLKPGVYQCKSNIRLWEYKEQK